MISFKIPSKVHSEVISYDQTKKSELSINRKSKGARFPAAGIPENLVPENVLPKKDLLKAIADLNSSNVDYCFWDHPPAKIYTNNNYVICICLVHQKIWYAFWYDKTNTNDECVFEESFVLRNTKVITNIPQTIKNHYGLKSKLTIENLNLTSNEYDAHLLFTETKIDRKAYLSFRRKITKKDLINKEYEVPELLRRVKFAVKQVNEFSSYLNNFDKSFSRTLNDFDIGPVAISDNFSRDNVPFTYYEKIFRTYEKSVYSMFFRYKINFANKKEEFLWLPTLNDHIVEALSYYVYNKEENQETLNKFSNFLNTPYFQKEFGNAFNNLLNTYYYTSDYPPLAYFNYNIPYHKEFTFKIQLLYLVFVIYKENTNLDLIQQMWKILDTDKSIHIQYRLGSSYFNVAAEWIENNIPQKSFTSMIIKNTSEMIDTVNMLCDFLYEKEDTFEYKGRWRISEFHDYVMSEHWKLHNKNTPLPAEMFPTPITVGEYTIMQPKNTHDLALWGRKVRNCVGSGYYCDSIKKKQSFIFLISKNNTPEYTIQASLNDGILTVTQQQSMSRGYNMKGNEYNKVFKTALSIREKQLKECSS